MKRPSTDAKEGDRERIEAYLAQNAQTTKTEMAKALDIHIQELHGHILALIREKKALFRQGKVIWTGTSLEEAQADVPSTPMPKPEITPTDREYTEEQRRRIPSGVIYEDWNGNLREAIRMRELGIYSLYSGPKGSGKTTLAYYLAQELKMPIYSINLSLRAREHHLVGRPTLREGSEEYKEGVVVASMKAGGILYLDELNAAEPDALLRLDEALDDRKEVNVEGQHYEAEEGWYVIGSINPLSHAGTKELPPQILSRFGARLRFPYPEPEQELRIIEAHLGRVEKREEIMSLLRTISMLREEGINLQYVPSIRESLSASRMVLGGYSVEEALKYAVINTYAQWGEVKMLEVKELIKSKGGA